MAIQCAKCGAMIESARELYSEKGHICTELSLLVIDLGAECVVKVERGEFDE